MHDPNRVSNGLSYLVDSIAYQTKEITMNPEEPNSINMDIRFVPLEVVDIQSLINTATDAGYIQPIVVPGE